MLSPNDFTDPAVIEQWLADFEASYHDTARPFAWNFTTADLADLITRIEQHEQAAEPVAPTTPAAA